MISTGNARARMRPCTLLLAATVAAVLFSAPVAHAQVSPDFDGDGAVLTADLATFVNEWNRELNLEFRAADVNEDGEITPGDISEFIVLWTAAIAQGYVPPPGPRAPTLTRALNVGVSGTVDVFWTDNSGDESAFEILRQTKIGAGTPPQYSSNFTAMAGAGATAYAEMPGPGEYRYRVRAVGPGGASLYSPWAYVTVAPQPDALPPLRDWSSLAAQPGARVYHVSSSLGSDAYPGTQALPLRTLAAAQARMRQFQSDQMLLRKGDEWKESLTLLITGKSPDEPAVIGAYGSGPRPRIVGTLTRGSNAHSKGNLLISGLEIVDPFPGGHELIEWQGGQQPVGGANVTIEDCYIHLGYRNIVLQGTLGFTVRRCIITDAYTISPNCCGAIGLYVALSRDCLIEENVFDHNGWPTPGLYHHNVYMQSDNQTPLIFRRNIVVGAPSHGLQMRSGGTVLDNVFVHNGLGVEFGHLECGNYCQSGVTGVIRGNIVLEGSDITPNDLRGVGISLDNISASGVDVRDNIIANAVSAGAGGAIVCSADRQIRSATLRGNIVYHWRFGLWSVSHAPIAGLLVDGNIFEGDNPSGSLGAFNTVDPFRFQRNRYSTSTGSWFIIDGNDWSFEDWQANVEPTAAVGTIAFPAPERSLATFAASQGLASTTDAIMTALRAQSRDAWNGSIAIDPLLTYLRAGFGR